MSLPNAMAGDLMALSIVLVGQSVVIGLMGEEVGGPDGAAVGVGEGPVKDALVVSVRGDGRDGVVERQVHNLGDRKVLMHISMLWKFHDDYHGRVGRWHIGQRP